YLGRPIPIVRRSFGKLSGEGDCGDLNTVGPSIPMHGLACLNERIGEDFIECIYGSRRNATGDQARNDFVPTQCANPLLDDRLEDVTILLSRAARGKAQILAQLADT